MINYCGECKFLIKVINCKAAVRLRIVDSKIIAAIVSNIFEVSAKWLIGSFVPIGRGNRTVSDARHTVIHFISVHTKMTKKSIGLLVGRDHSTVIYAERNVNRLMSDKSYRKRYLECDQLIREYLNSKDETVR
jgi:chromosomal replication initiation ATPase DnaA